MVAPVEFEQAEEKAPTGAADLPTSFPHLSALDGLRGVAVLSVVAYHFGAGWLPGGFLGVDTFFVLSGYLITSLLLVEWGRRAGTDLAAFWVRRARRLLPALCLMLVAVVVWGSIVLPADRLGGLRADSLWTLFYGANWHYVLSEQSYFELMSAASPLRHTWSLAIEEQFYLLWPLLFVGAMTVVRGRVRLLVALCVAGTVASLAVMAALFTEGDPSRAYYGTDARAHGLLLGALIAVALAHRPHVLARGSGPGGRLLVAATGGRAARAAGLVGASVMAVLFLVAEDRDAWLYPWGFLVFELAVVAVIVAIGSGPSALRAALSWSVLCWVGAVSYGLYLWHWPVIVFLHEGNTGLDGWSLFVLRAAVILGATTASYYLLEQPIRHGRWLHGRTALVAVPVGVALVVGTVLVQTRNAAAPPDYLVADPTSVLSVGEGGPASPATGEGDEGVAGDPAAPPAAIGPVVLMGDSIAASLAPALATYAAEAGVSFSSAALPGCSMVTGLAAGGPASEPIEWADECEQALPGFQDGLAARQGAAEVVWLSTWETADRWVDGTLYRFGTPEADEMLLQLIDEARERVLADSDALLVLAVPPPNAATSDLGAANADNVDRMVHLGDLLRTYASEHPGDVRVVDLSAIVCPDGPPCPEEQDGVTLRPRDGGHYSEDGGAWLAPRLFEALSASVA
jgi:peptidoglycan/LPS O-acetylase OafA/YrhL